MPWCPRNRSSPPSSGDMSGGQRVKITARLIITIAAFAIALAAPVHADVDTDFANELHTYGIYGPRDFNAWIGKIVCNRLYNGVDQDAYKSAQFVSINLQRGSTTDQSWQFLGAALRTYCPDQLPVLERAAAH